MLRSGADSINHRGRNQFNRREPFRLLAGTFMCRFAARADESRSSQMLAGGFIPPEAARPIRYSACRAMRLLAAAV